MVSCSRRALAASSPQPQDWPRRGAHLARRPDRRRGVRSRRVPSVRDRPAAGRDFGEFLGSLDGQATLSGSWLWLGILLAFFVFNTVLGEELLFRGNLLPRLQGVFGSRDWNANGILFAVYHLHVPWMIPITRIDTFILSLPSRRYQSALIGIIAHSAQSVFLFALVLMLFLTP